MMILSAVMLMTRTPVLANKADWSKWVGSTSGNSYEKVYDDLENIVHAVIVFGGLWVIGCLVFAGIRLSAAQGSNPQARTQGFIGLAMAAVGGLIIIKSYDIAGYIASFGS